MRVVSTLTRFIGGSRVRPGTEFEVPDGTKLTADMRVVSTKAKAEKPAVKQVGPATFSEIARRDGKDTAPRGEATKGDATGLV